MLGYSTEELLLRWEEFFDELDYAGRITAIADAYPEERSLPVQYADVERFDSDLALYLMDHPQNALYAAEQAIKQFIPPTEEAEIHFRIRAVPRDLRVEVRDLRAKHLGRLVSVEGLVRKATEVRPRLVEAVFQCLRCGAIIKELQEGMDYREPLECYQDQGGCARTSGSTKFKLLDEGSRFVDTQKIEIQEPPEELRGGEAPQRLVAYLEDDLVGEINPGDRVVLNGVLRSSQRGRFSARSNLFDIFSDVNSVEMEEVEFEEVEVTQEDEERIKQEAASGDVIRNIVASIAPSIYGMTVEKEALALQLFGGVPKELPDSRRIRGDMHILLVGDPGTAKSELLTYMARLSPRGIYASGKAATAAGLCVTGDTLVHTPHGFRRIRDIVETHIPAPVTSETCAEHSEPVYTLRDGQVVIGNTSLAWRMPRKPCYRLTTSKGKYLEASRNTMLLTSSNNGEVWKPIKDLERGDFVAAPEDITGRHDHTNEDHLPVAGRPDHSDAQRDTHWVYLREQRNPSRGQGAQILAEVPREDSIRSRATEVLMVNITWEQVVEVQSTGLKEVFDLTVPGSHNFVGNGLVVHNTAAAVRDEFGEGRWTLEAGALVLADKGHCMIDEIEKMSDQDRSAIHTAMEQQTIHVAKAGITATLQTRCAILAAANPTLGRFDENKYISEQINLPPTLLSRFDCIFPVMDKPHAQYDEAMAEHILKGHLVGEHIRRAETERRVAVEEEIDSAFRPLLEPAFLRKYVAYGKRIFPVLTDDAMRILKDKYLEIRRQGEGDGGTVPITPRQLEAFIRLAEASARIRLSPQVQAEDAERSVRIIEYWLQKVTGLEGAFDIDVVATGVSSSQRVQMVALRDIIAELSERDGVADIKDIMEKAEERGIPPSRVESWLKRWSQEGEVYSPAANKWKLVSRF